MTPSSTSLLARLLAALFVSEYDQLSSSKKIKLLFPNSSTVFSNEWAKDSLSSGSGNLYFKRGIIYFSSPRTRKNSLIFLKMY